VPKAIRKITDVVSGKSRGLDGEHLLDVEDVARLLKISVSILCKWRLLGKGPAFVRIGAAVRYRPADVQAFIDEGARGSISEERPPPAA
jgi:hypothetical protein